MKVIHTEEKNLSFAAIDIGSNAIRLLIKSVELGAPASQMRKTQMVRVPIRLGEDSFVRGAISGAKVDQLIRLMKSYKLLMKVCGVIGYRACATSAMRDASNGKVVVAKIREKTGIDIEIISGLEEARIVYESHIADLLNKEADYIYVDVGGGSTEISLIHSGELRKSSTYNIGTVRMLSGKVKPSETAKLNRYLESLAVRYPGLNIIGSGGNINKLYRLADNCKQNYLQITSLEKIYDMLRDKSIEERIAQFGLNRDRADVIIPAAEIFLNIARRIRAERIFVPTIGISDGIIHALYTDYLNDTSR